MNDEMNELFDVEVEKTDRRKGALAWFHKKKISSAKAVAIGAASVVALATPVVLFASRDNSPTASVETTVTSGDSVTTTTMGDEATTSLVSGGGKKSNSGKKPGLVLPTRGVVPTATSTSTTIVNDGTSTTIIAPPAPPIVLAPPTTNAPGSVPRTIQFGSAVSLVKTYGELAFAISPATPSIGAGAVTYSSSNSSVCTVDLVSGEVSLVGTGSCEISASVPASGTYASAVTTTNVAVTVNKASLTITASSASIAFSPRSYVVTAAYSGFVNGEDSSVLTMLPTCVVVQPSDFEISSNDRRIYATSCSGAASLNYDISYVGGVLTVSNRS